MKILIGYDGSQTADAALDDLKLAGLPADTRAVVLSVAEVWLAPDKSEESGEEAEVNPYLEKLSEKYREKGRRAVAEALASADRAGERLRRIFPGWQVETEATFGSPAWEIVNRAQEIEADLIVVGSHGRSGFGRFFLGSISQKVLTEARSSVRVARGRVEVDPVPSRIVVGFDGSPGALAAIEAVSSRNWREMSEVRLVTVADRGPKPTAIGNYIPPIAGWTESEIQAERELIERVADEALGKLRAKGLEATLAVLEGNPKTALVEEAERWHADSIFVGANAFGSRLERFLLGSTSAAVAARAHCTVEIVRKPATDSNQE